MDSFSNKRNKTEGGTNDLEVMGVSRSGRVRKKSSKLVDFESPDDIDNRYTKRFALGASPTARSKSHISDHSDQLLRKTVIANNPISSDLRPSDTIKTAGSYDEFSDNIDSIHYENEADNSSHLDSADSTAEVSDAAEHEEDDDGGGGGDEDDTFDNKNNNDDDGMDEEDDAGEEHGDDDDEDDDADQRPNEDGFRRLDEQAQLGSTTGNHSLYMMEKTKKRLVIKNGKIVKAQRKDKGKTRCTAYMLWAKEIRRELFKNTPDLDFSTMSKKLGELWATVPNSEKITWRRRAKRLNAKPDTAATATSNINTDATASINNNRKFKTTGKNNKFINKRIMAKISSPPRSNATSTPLVLKSPDSKSLNSTLQSDSLMNNHNSGSVQKTMPGATQPVDVAAHLKLLGESLMIIGERLKEHEGQIAVSGSLSVLLDSLLCAMGPLLCITQLIPEIGENGSPPETLAKTLDNIAYIMPGL